VLFHCSSALSTALLLLPSNLKFSFLRMIPSLLGLNNSIITSMTGTYLSRATNPIKKLEDFVPFTPFSQYWTVGWIQTQGPNVIKLLTTVIYFHSIVTPSFCVIKQHYLGIYCGMAVNYHRICVTNVIKHNLT